MFYNKIYPSAKRKSIDLWEEDWISFDLHLGKIDRSYELRFIDLLEKRWIGIPGKDQFLLFSEKTLSFSQGNSLPFADFFCILKKTLSSFLSFLFSFSFFRFCCRRYSSLLWKRTFCEQSLYLLWACILLFYHIGSAMKKIFRSSALTEKYSFGYSWKNQLHEKILLVFSKKPLCSSTCISKTIHKQNSSIPASIAAVSELHCSMKKMFKVL